jgi:hypothetical protein
MEVVKDLHTGVRHNTLKIVDMNPFFKYPFQRGPKVM